MRRWLPFATALVVVGCAPRERLDLDVDADALVIAVTVDGSGRGGAGLQRASEGVVLPFGADVSLYTWTIPAGDLRDATGAQLGPAELETLTVSLDAELGSCGRCLSPGVLAPKIVIPGESCPIPEFATPQRFSYVGGELVADPNVPDLSLEVRLNAGGDCECKANEPAPGLVESCTGVPTETPVLGESWVVNNDGVLLTMNEGFAARTNGSTITQTAFQPAFHTTPWVGILPDGAFGMLATGVAQGDVEELIRFDDALRPILVRGRPERSELDGLKTIGPNELLLLGELDTGVGGDQPMIARCDYDANEIDCKLEQVLFRERCDDAIERTIRGVYEYGDGMAVGITGASDVFLRAKDSNAWYCDPESSANFVAARGANQFIHFKTAIRRGDQLLTCVELEAPGESEPGFQGLLLFDLVERTEAQLIPNVEFGLDYRLLKDFDTNCGAFSRSAEVVDGIVLSDDHGGGAWLVRPDDTVEPIEGIGRGGELLPDVPAVVLSFKELSGGRLFARTTAGTAYIRSSSTAAFEPLYAEPGGERDPLVLTTTADDTVLAFGRRAPLRVDVSADGPVACSDFSYTRQAPLRLELTDLEQITASAASLDDPDQVLLAVSGGSTPRLAWVDVASGEVLRNLPLPPSKAIRRLQSTGPGRFVGIAQDAIWEIVDADARILEPEFDDPATEFVESAPDQLRYHDLDVAQGIAWIGGRGVIARVLPAGPDRPGTVEAFWLSRADSPVFSEVSRGPPPEFTAVRAECADVFIGAATERVFRTSASPGLSTRFDVWRLGGEETCAGAGIDFSLCRYSGYDPDAPNTGSGRGAAAAVHSMGDRALIIFRDGQLHRVGNPRATLPISSVADAVGTSAGWSVAAGPGGHLVTVIQSD